MITLVSVMFFVLSLYLFYNFLTENSEKNHLYLMISVFVSCLIALANVMLTPGVYIGYIYLGFATIGASLHALLFHFGRWLKTKIKKD